MDKDAKKRLEVAVRFLKQNPALVEQAFRQARKNGGPNPVLFKHALNETLYTPVHKALTEALKGVEDKARRIFLYNDLGRRLRIMLKPKGKSGPKPKSERPLAQDPVVRAGAWVQELRFASRIPESDR